MSSLDFHPLTFVQERDGVTVGRADASSYVQMPTDGAELLRQMSGGMPAEQAAAWYQETFGQPVDIADFVDTLRDCGFVRDAGEQPTQAPPIRWSKLGRATFSPGAWLLYAAITAAACFELATKPALRPEPKDVFFVSTLLVVQVVIALLQSPAVLWHEWFHLLAARRLGLSSRLSIGRRYYYLVAETHLDALLSVPPRRRYLPMLAGMLADLLLYASLVLVAAALYRRGLAWPGRLALAIGYTILMRLAWQFYIFLRTDLYHVLTTALGCVNLHEASQAYSRHLLRRRAAAGRADWSEDAWSARDRRIAPWFLLMTFGGGLVMVGTAVFAALPVIVQFAELAWNGLTHGSQDAARFWGSAASVLLLTVEFIVLPLLAGRSWRQGREAGVPVRVTTD